MSHTYKNFATKISVKKGFLINPLIAFNKEHTVYIWVGCSKDKMTKPQSLGALSYVYCSKH